MTDVIEDEDLEALPDIVDDELYLGDDAPVSAAEPLSLSGIEQKYRSQMRQIFPSRIDLPMFTLVGQIDAQIDLRPNFQRRDRWNTAKRSKFIESIIMNVPVPPVFLGEEEYGKYVVLDGRQRLTSAYRFLKNEFKLRGLTIWDELNGLTYEGLKKRGFAPAIERRFLPAILLTRESSPEVKYEVFERLNTGGVPAKAMEVRNAVFPGPFNRLLHQLSSHDLFRALWGIPISKSRRELERSGAYRDMSDLELVLRFFALSEGTLSGMTYKERLSDFMAGRNKEYGLDPSLAEKDGSRFLNALQNAFRIFGDDAFRRLDQQDTPEKKRTRSAPYADAVLQGLADVPEPQTQRPAAQAAIRVAFSNLFENEKFRAAISTGTNGETAIQRRVLLARNAVQEALA